MSVEAPGRPDASGRGAAFSGAAGGDELTVVEPLIFERSRAERRAVRFPHASDAAREAGAGQPELPASVLRARGAAPAGGERARHAPPLQPAGAPEPGDRPQLLSARVVHDEVQPEGQRVGGAAARPGRVASARSRGAQPGQPRADVAAGRAAQGDQRLRRNQPPAGRRRARRADRHAHGARLPPRQRRGRPTHEGARAGQRARHESRPPPRWSDTRPSPFARTSAAGSTSTRCGRRSDPTSPR